jgi:DNA-binding LacI/PurR family transcriptional regulator
MAAAGATGLRLVCEEGVGNARELVAGLLDGPEHVDGIVCASDALAIGAHLAAAAAGRGDLPVIGFDNTPAAEALGISSVEQLPERVAAGAIELLMGESGSVVAPREPAAGRAHVLVEPELVVR